MKQTPEIDNKFLVEYKDTKYYLNSKLAAAQKLNDETIAKLVACHIKKLKLFEDILGYDKEQLKFAAEKYQDIEYELQELWGFVKDSNFHRWFDIPNCLCPKEDNLERLGTQYRIYTSGCPIHGQNT